MCTYLFVFGPGEVKRNWTAPGQWLASTATTPQPSTVMRAPMSMETMSSEGTDSTEARRRAVGALQKTRPRRQEGPRPA